MRERRASHRRKHELAGQLLLAHPALKDPNFRRAVVLMSVHNEDGAMGVVVNRPLQRRLGDLAVDFATGPLASVPLYAGGPVEPEQLVIAGWRWLVEEQAFQLHFGLEPDKAEELLALPGVTLRGFLGYSGWSKGQLENEMKHKTWFTTPADSSLLARCDGPELWRAILGSLDPELKLMAGEPDDPTVN